MTTVPIYNLDEPEYATPYYKIRNDYRTKYRGSHTPIIIDNGSYQCRAGWASESEPSRT
ncbi:uncharacterized protein BYT42DRAFT_557846 [Radiomyces spectabilis]|uniref:uncharacterized protein n=1 Tax=Radiomyces spectabilis TaxID=64574 RepID=UPI002220D030|nr:uncharacterized protein BYT42DRAFT_557846 [Radiomyces spectabilis]KAI8391729.1 hypothetical protein BYT42DRAFT_557846 [Radiomyces spectabilis]